MLLLKELIVFYAILFLSAAGLIEITDSSWNNYPQNKNASGQEIKKSGRSGQFIKYEQLILNEVIDNEKIRSDVERFRPGFEREYLLALLNKRRGEFRESFDLMFALLDQSLGYLNYYEELAYLGKITGNHEKILRWIDDKKDTGSSFYAYLTGLINFQKGNTSGSIETFNDLIEKGFIFKEIFYHLAYAYRIAGDYENSFATLTEAEKLCPSEDPFLPRIINLRGTLFFLSGEYEQAEHWFKSAQDIARENRNKPEEIKAFANLAVIKDIYGEVNAAREDFLSAIETAKKIENKELLAFIYSELGVSFTYTNNLIEARENYEKSYSLCKLLKNYERLSYLSGNIGSLYLQLSNYKSALKYYNEGYTYAGENKLGQILNLTGIADVYSNESNYTKALQYYNRAGELADSIKDISSMVKIDQGMGALFYNINRPEKSLEILRGAESKINANEMPYEMSGLYSKIGTVLTFLDSLKQAEDYFQKGIKLSDQAGDIYSSIVLKTELAYNLLKQNNIVEAANSLSIAQKSAGEYELMQVIALQDLYWGQIFEAENRMLKARKNFEASFRLSESVHDINTQIEAGYLLAKNFEEAGNYKSAEEWYLTTAELIEKISFPLRLNQEIQISHFSGLNDVYNSLAGLYLKQGKGLEAFSVIEKSRSRNTRTNLEKLKLLSFLEDEADYNQLIDLEWMITSGLYSSGMVDSLQNVLDGIKDELIGKNGNLAEILNADYSFNREEVQKNLSSEEYLISVYAGNDFLALFNLNSKGFYFKTLDISRDSLLCLIKSVSPIYKSGLDNEEIYINEDLFSFNAFAAYRLYELVFREFLTSIPDGSILIVTLPPELVKLPLEMLVTEWRQGESPYYYADKNFLINKFQVVYTPSLSIYNIQKNKILSDRKRNLLVGDPFINNTQFSLSVRSGLIDDNLSPARNIRLFPLEYSDDEINGIEGTITNSIVLLSEEATESNFKQNVVSSNIVHISSHSFLLKDQPFILFTPQEDRQDDGFLELGEIVQLNLNSDLVVISSCRSGLGKVDAAEGILGMQKAFFEAGSSSILVALWDVSDKYTSYFMQDFYKYLKDGKSKPDALRRAKLDFIKNHSANPYFWSAFVFAGNTSAIKFESSRNYILLYFISGLFVIGVLISFLFRRVKSFS